MDKKIISLFSANKSGQLDQLLKSLSEDEIRSLINRSKGDPTALLRSLICGSSCENNEGIQRRMCVYKHCINLLQKNELHPKTASEIVGFLMLEADGFPASSLAELAAIYIDAIKTGTAGSSKWLELFPKILSSLAAQEAVTYAGNQMNGAEYKSHVLNSVCSSKWDPQNVIHLVSMFRDISLSSDELKFVINKVMRLLNDLDLQELPPLVYQLLLLSTKGHKKVVLEGITDFFSQQDKKCTEQAQQQIDCDLVESSSSPDQLRHVEGTVILHITFAIKQDQELGREFIKYLKSQQNNPGRVLSPFNVALALSIARIHRFEDQVFDFLKGSVLRCFKDVEKQEESFWVKEMAPSIFSVDEVMLDTVSNSMYGWDHVTQGIVQLGFLLMDAFGPRGAFGRVTDSSPTATQTPNQKACKLGSMILFKTFKVHEMVRAEILEQILNRVVTKATAPVSHYLELLSETVKSAPQIILDCLPKVREAFDYLSMLPPTTAVSLLQAIQPLMKISMSLKDSLMLVLRKAMFSRQLESRKVAVSGFLMILQHFRVIGGVQSSQNSMNICASQVSVEVHRAHNPASNEALCLEILGNLRRCMSQQADVRLMLYEGLYDVLHNNTQLSDSILRMLHSQFMKYFEASDDVTPPLKLDLCISAQADQVYLAEPLAHLLSCIEQCLRKASSLRDSDTDNDDADYSSLGEFESVMESLTRRMVKCEMEDFELDKSADFSVANSVGVKNSIFAILVMGIYEVLMEYTFTPENIEQSMIEQVLALYRNYQSLANVLKDKNNAAGAKKASLPSNKTARSLLSIRFVASILRALFHDSVPLHQDSLNQLRQNVDFVRYVVSVAQQKVQQINDRGSCDGLEGQSSDKLFKYCCSIARVLLKHYTSELHAGDEAAKGRAKSATVLCLETLGTIVNIMCTRYPARLIEFLSAIDSNRNSGTGIDKDTDSETVHLHIKKFQRLVMTIVGGTNEDHSLKEAVVLLNVIGSLTKQLKPDQSQFTQVQSWLQRLCTEQNPDDVGVVKVLLSLLFSMTSQQKSSVSLNRDVAQDIHSQLGDIDQDVEVEARTHFAFINPKMAAPTVLLLVLNHVDRELDDTDWVVNRMKGEALTTSSQAGDSSEGLTQREAQDKSVCSRLGVIVTMFHELVQSAVPPGVCVENMVKTVTRLYSSLTILVKYYLWLYNQRIGHLSARFEKLVKLSGTHLTQYVYAMITYIQAAQNEHLQRQVEKAGKKDKKKNVAPLGKNQIMKETRSVPNLIFAIEQYERYLIQLSKKSKINLMENMKVSTSRDFRINAAQLQAALEKQSSSDEEESESNDEEESDQENTAPPSNKKAKIVNESAPKKGKSGKDKIKKPKSKP